jgi:hypothetical protein
MAKLFGKPRADLDFSDKLSFLLYARFFFFAKSKFDKSICAKAAYFNFGWLDLGSISLIAGGVIRGTICTAEPLNKLSDYFFWLVVDKNPL